MMAHSVVCCQLPTAVYFFKRLITNTKSDLEIPTGNLGTLTDLVYNIRLRNLPLAKANKENLLLCFREHFADLTARSIHLNGLRIAWVNSEFKFPIPGIKGFARIPPLQKHYNMILNLGAGCIGRVHCRACVCCAHIRLTG
jgi:hypothetical protein